jgi:hypothetical protein
MPLSTSSKLLSLARHVKSLIVAVMWAPVLPGWEVLSGRNNTVASSQLWPTHGPVAVVPLQVLWQVEMLW